MAGPPAKVETIIRPAWTRQLTWPWTKMETFFLSYRGVNRFDDLTCSRVALLLSLETGSRDWAVTEDPQRVPDFTILRVLPLMRAEIFAFQIPARCPIPEQTRH